MLPTIGNATLCGDRRGRGAKTRGVFFLGGAVPRATLCGDRRGRGANKNSRFFAPATLCGDRRGRGAKTRGFLRFCSRMNPLRGSCVSKRSRCGAVQILLSLGEPSCVLAKWPLEVVSRLLSQSRGRGFDSPLVRGSSGLTIAAFKYKRSTRSVLLQLQVENRNF